MGRKIKIEDEDPIIKKNPKLQKRKKQRAEERKRLEEEKEKQKKITEEYNRVKEEIIKEQQQTLRRIIGHEQNKQTFMQTIGAKGKEKETKIKQKALAHKKDLPIIKLKEMQIQNNKQLYTAHFTQIDEKILQRVQKRLRLNQNQIVKNELRELFGKQPIQQPKLLQQGSEEYKIRPELKFPAKQYRIQQQDYLVSPLALKQVESSMIKKSNVYESFISSYKDLVYIENQEESSIDQFRRKIVIHALQHIHLASQSQKSNGFTNCRILILTPFVGDAGVFIDIIKSLVQLKQINSERLEQLDDDSDLFRISLKINPKKKTIKYFTTFDKADIIIASPLGLRMITGVEGDQERDFSFLSSVEMLYIDRAQVIMMQNWLHLVEVVKSINKIPKYQSLANDIQTIRKPFLQQKGKFYRQNIVFSEYMFPELNSLVKRYFENWEGYSQKVNYYIETTFPYKFQQQFFRIPDCSFQQDLQVRLDYFKRKIWPRISNNEQLQRVLIFSSNPFQFVKIKSYLQKVNADADFISEHTPKNKTQSRIARFNNKQFRILLLSERAYYFEICQVSKIQNILFYSIPRNKWIYENLINSLINPKTGHQGASLSNTIIGMFSRYEAHAIQRIAGTVKALQLVAAEVRCDNFIL